MTRRSESCPRLSRKGSTPADLPATALAPAPRSCTLQDLGPEDRQKVAKLLKQVVDLGQEVQQLKLQRDEQAKAFAQREQDLQETNRQLHNEQQLLKKKLGQVLLVLRASQVKVNAFEAAQQAARGAQCCAQVQTDPVTPVDQPEPTNAVPPVLTASGTANGTPASALAAVDGAACLDSGILRSSFSGPKGIPSLLHVAPGAHVNITINHVPEASAAGPAAPTTQAACSASAPANAASGGCGEVPDSAGALQQPTAVVTIPTTTATAAAMAATAFVASTCSTEAALPELPSSCESPSVASSRVGCQQLNVGTGARSVHALPRPDAITTAGAVVATGGGPRELCLSGITRLSCAPVGSAPCKPTHPRSILIDTTMQQFETVPVHEVVVNSHEPPVASPMIVPPSEEVVAAASSLLDWQTQHGFVSADEAAGALSGSATPLQPSNLASARSQLPGRKVLSYDPAIGKSGAFYFVDIAGECASLLGADGAVGAAAAERTVDAMNKRDQAAHPATDSCSALAAHAGHKLQVMSTATHGVRGNPDAPLTSPEGTLPPLDAAGPPRAPGPYGSHHVGRPVANVRTEPTVLRARQFRAPLSPCDSEFTDSTAVPSPLLHAPRLPPGHGCSDTPPGSSISLSRMAVALEEVARRQRWDLEPPPDVPQQYNPGPVARGAQSVRTAWGPQAAVEAEGYGGAQNGPCGPRSADNASNWSASGVCPARPHPQPQGVGPHPAVFRHASSSSGMGGRGFCDAPQDCPTPGDSRSACSSSMFTWMEGSELAERYDDSLVDILSKADEELEQQLCRSQENTASQRTRPRSQRTHQSVALPAVRHRAAPLVLSPSSGPPPRAKQQAGSTEAFLAANLYEENDVLSVILEQEDD